MKCTYLLISVAIFAQACASAPPCEPEIVEVLTPVVSCPSPPQLPEILLPTKPILPENATQDEVKNWYADMVEWIKLRDSLKDARIESLEELLDVYREEPQ